MDAFQQAANQFYSKMEKEERKKKEEGTITIHPKTGKREDGEYVPYEEIK